MCPHGCLDRSGGPPGTRCALRDSARDVVETVAAANIPLASGRLRAAPSRRARHPPCPNRAPLCRYRYRSPTGWTLHETVTVRPGVAVSSCASGRFKLRAGLETGSGIYTALRQATHPQSPSPATHTRFHQRRRSAVILEGATSPSKRPPTLVQRVRPWRHAPQSPSKEAQIRGSIGTHSCDRWQACSPGNYGTLLWVSSCGWTPQHQRFRAWCGRLFGRRAASRNSSPLGRKRRAHSGRWRRRRTTIRRCRSRDLRSWQGSARAWTQKSRPAGFATGRPA